MDNTAFAQRVLADGWLPDPWLDGKPRLDPQSLLLQAPHAARLCHAAEAVAMACDALCRFVLTRPQLLTPLQLQPFQMALWLSSAPHWHGLARADVFETTDGALQVCEMNCDTPSGIAEALVLGRLSAHQPGMDANRTLMARWVALLTRLTRKLRGPQQPLTCGILSPTEQTEDLPMLLLWRQALEQAGWQVAQGSPFNLQPHRDGRVALFGVPCDVIVRHYKTDWWAERRPVWRDQEPFTDNQPLLRPLQVLLAAQVRGATVVVNPLGSIVPQNKRFFALLWQHRQRLGQPVQLAIERFVPFTTLLEAQDPAKLESEQTQWVLKSDYGCEGDEVVVGAEVSAEAWRKALQLAEPGRWIAQRYFEPKRDARGEQTNFGVYLLGGEASGILARISNLATDRTARMTAVRIVAQGTA